MAAEFETVKQFEQDETEPASEFTEKLLLSTIDRVARTGHNTYNEHRLFMRLNDNLAVRVVKHDFPDIDYSSFAQFGGEEPPTLLASVFILETEEDGVHNVAYRWEFHKNIAGEVVLSYERSRDLVRTVEEVKQDLKLTIFEDSRLTTEELARKRYLEEVKVNNPSFMGTPSEAMVRELISYLDSLPVPA